MTRTLPNTVNFLKIHLFDYHTCRYQHNTFAYSDGSRTV